MNLGFFQIFGVNPPIADRPVAAAGPQVDVLHVGNNAGQVDQAQTRFSLTPHLELAAGIGSLQFTRHTEALPFGTLRFTGNWRLGNRMHFLGNYGITCSGESNQFSGGCFQSLALGVTHAIVATPHFGITVGAMLHGSIQSMVPFDIPNAAQGHSHFDVGLAIRFRQLQVYGIQRLLLDIERPYDQYWTSLRAFPMETEVGARLNTRGLQPQISYTHTPFSDGVMIALGLPNVPLNPNLFARYTHYEGPLETSDQATLTLQFSLDGPRPRRLGAIRTADESLLQLRGPARNATHQSISTHFVPDRVLQISSRTSSHFSGLTWTLNGLVRQFSDLLSQEGSRSVMEIPPNDENGIPGSIILTNGEERISIPLNSMGGFIVSGIRYSSNNLPNSIYLFPEEGFRPIDPEMTQLMSGIEHHQSLASLARGFGQNSPQQILRMAARLARLAAEQYDYRLYRASVFSQERNELSVLSPERVYDHLRRSLINGERLSVGLCATIHTFIAEFLRQTGFEARAISIPNPRGLHVVSLATIPGSNRNHIIDYGELYSADGNSMWSVIEEYARENRILIQGIRVYDENNRLMGFYGGPEGELMRGVNQEQVARDLFLGTLLEAPSR